MVEVKGWTHGGFLEYHPKIKFRTAEEAQAEGLRFADVFTAPDPDRVPMPPTACNAPFNRP